MLKLILTVWSLLVSPIETQFVPTMETDFECMYTTVYYEAGNQDILGKLAVASVVKNRKRHRRYGDTICEVATRRHQFSYYWDGKQEYIPRDMSKMEQEAVRDSKLVAALVLTIEMIDVTNGSLYYHNDTIEKPDDFPQLAEAMPIGNHIFYNPRIVSGE